MPHALHLFFPGALFVSWFCRALMCRCQCGCLCTVILYGLNVQQSSLDLEHVVIPTDRRTEGPIDIIIDSDVRISDSAYLYTSESYIFQFSLCMGISSAPPSLCAIHMHAHHIFAYQVSVCRVMLLIDKVLRLQRFQLEFHLRNFVGKSAFYVFGQFGVNNFAKQRKWWKLTFPYGTKVIAWWIWIRTWKKNICKAPTADEDSHKAKLIKRNW